MWSKTCFCWFSYFKKYLKVFSTTECQILLFTTLYSSTQGIIKSSTVRMEKFKIFKVGTSHKNKQTHTQKCWRTCEAEIHPSFAHAHTDPHTVLLVAKYLFTHSHWRGDFNGKGHPPPGANQSACSHALRQPSCGTGLVVKSSFMYDVCEWIWVQSLCANSHVGNCFDQTLTNEREQDKRQTHAEHRTGFLFISVSLTF